MRTAVLSPDLAGEAGSTTCNDCVDADVRRHYPCPSESTPREASRLRPNAWHRHYSKGRHQLDRT
jgi:hypothetical protein